MIKVYRLTKTIGMLGVYLSERAWLEGLDDVNHLPYVYHPLLTLPEQQKR